MNSTAQIQTLLREEFPDIVVDGIYGPRTSKAVKLASPALRARIDDVNRRSQGKAGETWLSPAELSAVIRNVAADTGVRESYLRLLAELEPRRRIINGEVHVDAYSVNGPYKGLGQMGKPAWTDAAALDPTIGQYVTNWYKPYESLRAAARFLQVNKRYIQRKYGYVGEVSDELGYAMHNQGHTVFKRIIDGKAIQFPAQSKKALAVIESARREYGVA